MGAVFLLVLGCCGVVCGVGEILSGCCVFAVWNFQASKRMWGVVDGGTKREKEGEGEERRRTDLDAHVLVQEEVSQLQVAVIVEHGGASQRKMGEREG